MRCATSAGRSTSPERSRRTSAGRWNGHETPPGRRTRQVPDRMATPPNFTTRRTVAGAMCCAPGRPPSTPCRACFPTGPKREVRPRVCSGAACGRESPTCIGGPEVSQNANERLLNALASVDDSRSVEELTAQIQTHNHWGGRRVRGLRPWGEDKELLSAVNHGEFLINGLRNRDLQKLLYSAEAESPQCAGGVLPP